MELRVFGTTEGAGLGGNGFKKEERESRSGVGGERRRKGSMGDVMGKR